MRIEMLLTFLPGLILGVTVHEAAHAWSAMLLGDGLSRSMGRVSLNPARHLSPMGTLALFVLGFGWGRPVVVNLYNFEKPKLYYLLSSLAGPASNLMVCVICMVFLKVLPEDGFIYNLIWGTYMINGLLFALNMIPIPPLDGSKIWICLIPGLRPISSAKWNLIWLGVLLVLLFTGVIPQIIFKVLGVLTEVLSKIVF